MRKSYFFGRFKITTLTCFNCVQLTFSMNKRVGQSAKAYIDGNETCVNDCRNYITFSTIVDSKNYRNLRDLVMDTYKKVNVQLYVNLDSDRASYEIARALS